MAGPTPTTIVKHVQETPEEIWRIDHGQKGYPMVDVYTTVNEVVQKVLPKRVEYVDRDTVNIYFSQARTGFATVVV